MKVGRNQPCPCGSGKKYKKCCLADDEAGKSNVEHVDFGRQRLRDTENSVVTKLLDFAEERFGEDALMEAMSEFFLWPEEEPENELLEMMMDAFAPWFVFAWDAIEFAEEQGLAEDGDPEEADDLEFPEKSLGMLLLEEQPDRVDEFEKKFIREAVAQPYSFFQVIDAEPGKCLHLWDLLLNRKVTVAEQQASTQDIKSAILFTKVITLEGTSVMLGCFSSICPARYQGKLVDFRHGLEEERGRLEPADIREFDFELRETFVDIYLYEVENPFPQMQNTDGEPLVPAKLIYELACTPAQAFKALKTLAKGEDEDDLLTDAVYDDFGQLEKVSFSWLKKGNQKHLSWENTILGTIRIDGKSLTAEVNSENRAKKLGGEIKKRLKDRAIYKNTVFTSAEKMMEEAQGAEPAQASGMNREELMQNPGIREKIEEMARDHWEKWLDTSLPALDDMTPRQAAEDPVGRDKLEGLLLSFEASAHRERGKDDLSGEFAPDIKKLRKELGMEDG
ncbi:MAG: SEC-C domain-containing protein [Desulfosalsimonas sp.]